MDQSTDRDLSKILQRSESAQSKESSRAAIEAVPNHAPALTQNPVHNNLTIPQKKVKKKKSSQMADSS